MTSSMIKEFMDAEILPKHGPLLTIVCDNARVVHYHVSSSSRKRGRQFLAGYCPSSSLLLGAPAAGTNSSSSRGDRWSPDAGKSCRKGSNSNNIVNNNTNHSSSSRGGGIENDDRSMECRWDALVKSEKEQDCTMHNCLPARQGPMSPPPTPLSSSSSSSSSSLTLTCLVDFKFSGISSLDSINNQNNKNNPRHWERRGSKDSSTMVSIDTVYEMISLSSLESSSEQDSSSLLGVGGVLPVVPTAPQQFSDIARVA